MEIENVLTPYFFTAKFELASCVYTGQRVERLSVLYIVGANLESLLRVSVCRTQSLGESLLPDGTQPMDNEI